MIRFRAGAAPLAVYAVVIVVVFGSSVTWGPAPVWEGALVALPSSLAVVALAMRR